MIFRPCCARVLLAAAGVLAFAPWVAAGPVQYTNQTRRIDASLTEVYLGPEGQETPITDSESASAPDVGAFDATVTAAVENPPNGQSGQFAVSQRSTLADSGISAGGRFDGFTATEGGDYSGSSLVDVTFVLDEPRRYSLDYGMEVPSFFENVNSELSLTRAAGGAVVFDEDLRFNETNDNGEVGSFGSRTGTLAPGEYRLVFRHAYDSDLSGPEPYTMSLDFTPVGGGPNAIPLPPAAWAALATAGGFGGLRACRRWISRRK